MTLPITIKCKYLQLKYLVQVMLFSAECRALKIIGNIVLKIFGIDGASKYSFYESSKVYNGCFHRLLEAKGNIHFMRWADNVGIIDIDLK